MAGQTQRWSCGAGWFPIHEQGNLGKHFILLILGRVRQAGIAFRAERPADVPRGELVDASVHTGAVGENDQHDRSTLSRFGCG